MCYGVPPNSYDCQQYIKTGVCLAVASGETTCRNPYGNTMISFVNASNMIAKHVREKKLTSSEQK
jgi:hypothetical protein